MNSRLFTRIGLTVLSAALLFACSATSSDDKAERLAKLKEQREALTAEIEKLEKEVKAVTVQQVTTEKFDHYVQTQGYIESENSVVVSAEAMGSVTRVLVTEGATVSKGQVLAQIDNSVIQRNIESMQAQLELATSVYERQKNLWDQNIGTEVQFLQAKTNKEALEKQLASLKEQSDKTRIKSPISGTVDQVIIKAGENIAPGMPAVRIVNTDDLKIQAQVSEAYVTRVKKGNKAIVTIAELKKDVEAKVTFVGKTIDRLSRTFTVEIDLPRDPDLRPNMTATVKVIFETNPEALVVPVNLIQQINDEKIVYTAEKKGDRYVARRNVVSVKGVYGYRAEVEGLKSGDSIITVGFQGLNDGDLLEI
jgi:membrane fusion protein (multidrug efflux system)